MVKDYVSYPKTFEGYKWYKPIVTMVLTLVISVLLVAVELSVVYMVGGMPNRPSAAGYEMLNNMDFTSIAMLLTVVMLIPALYIANKVLNFRPFSSYASSRGGWNWKLYLKCLAVPLAVYFVYYIVLGLIFPPQNGLKPLAIPILLLLIIIVPLQCIAEEFIFRGLLMQTFGAWFNIPILAIVIQAIIFAVLHDYNSLGVLAILVSGLIWGYITWKSNGIEASSALHSINNLSALIAAGIGLSAVSSTIAIDDIVVDIIVCFVSAALLFFVAKKYDWFGEEN